MRVTSFLSLENIEIPVGPPGEKDKLDSKYSDTEKNCVSRLHEFCQAYHLEQPVSVDVPQDERANPRLHYVAFQVGQQLYGVGEGWLVFTNSPKLSLDFPCKQVVKILFFILDKLLCMIICFILITKQLYLCG